LVQANRLEVGQKALGAMTQKMLLELDETNAEKQKYD
jgi:hypothetical protein